MIGETIHVPGNGEPIDAAAWGGARAARWAPGVMEQRKAEESPPFTCVACNEQRQDVGVLMGTGQVCAQCCLEAVRDKLEAQGKRGAMKTVVVLRTRAFGPNPAFDQNQPVSAANPKEVEREVADHVARHLGVVVRCTGKRCPDPLFRADFDEIVRQVECPNCHRLTDTPSAYWGNP